MDKTPSWRIPVRKRSQAIAPIVPVQPIQSPTELLSPPPPTPPTTPSSIEYTDVMEEAEDELRSAFTYDHDHDQRQRSNAIRTRRTDEEFPLTPGWDSQEITLVKRGPPNLMLLQISMPMIICEACYRFHFCGQDAVSCTSVVVHPTLRVPRIHFAFNKYGRQLFRFKTLSNSGFVSATPRYSQHFAAMEADADNGTLKIDRRSYSQHFAAMEEDAGNGTLKIDRRSYSQHFAAMEEDAGKNTLEIDDALSYSQHFAAMEADAGNNTLKIDRGSYSQHFAAMEEDAGKNTLKIDRGSYSQHFAAMEEDAGKKSPKKMTSIGRSHAQHFEADLKSPSRKSATASEAPLDQRLAGAGTQITVTGAVIPSTLQMLSSPSGLEMGRIDSIERRTDSPRESLIMRNYIELFASTPPPPPENPTHLFEDHNFTLPTPCKECGKWLWMVKGLKCQFCGVNIHRKCEHRVVSVCLPVSESKPKRKSKDKSKRKNKHKKTKSWLLSPKEFFNRKSLKKKKKKKSSLKKSRSVLSLKKSQKSGEHASASSGGEELSPEKSPRPPRKSTGDRAKRQMHVPRKTEAHAGIDRRVTRHWLKGVLLPRE